MNWLTQPNAVVMLIVLSAAITGFLAMRRRSATFKPSAIYYSDMDMMCYLTEDVSYSVDQRMELGEYLRILKHPYEDRVVGFQLYGFSALYKKATPAFITIWRFSLVRALRVAYACETKPVARGAIQHVMKTFPDATIRLDRCPQLAAA